MELSGGSEFPSGTTLGSRLAFAVSLLAAVAFWIAGSQSLAGVPFLASLISLAILARGSRSFSNAAFTLWMIASVAAPVFYPEWFRTWFGFELKRAVNPLIMVIMFGMGTALSLGDFHRVLLMPRAVVIGLLLKYTIMPLSGKLVAMTLASGSSDVAAGVILVGNVPAGATSNVINYLAGSNVALSVTLTALTTLLSPFVTPALTMVLGGVYLRVDFWGMMIAMATMVVVPVVLGILVNKVLRMMGSMHPRLSVISAGIFRVLPRFAMFAICAALAILTAAARGQLLGAAIVGAVLSAAFVHTALGLCLGYWACRLFRLDERTCRTIAVVIGMQNSGVAAGLAQDVFKKPLAAVPGVVCSAWQNMAGAALASWWRNRPLLEEAATEESAVQKPAPQSVLIKVGDGS
jgi:BASS family bile acid:Na+ symporter